MRSRSSTTSASTPTAAPAWPPTRPGQPGPLEAWEGLEQLRFMENGVPVHCVEVEGRGHAFWELNNPSDTPRIEAIFRELGIE